MSQFMQARTETVEAAELDPQGKYMIQGWIKMHRGDLEGVARYIAYSLHVCGIREARKIVAKAAENPIPTNYIASVS